MGGNSYDMYNPLYVFGGHTSAFVINCRAGHTEAQNNTENEKSAEMCKDCRCNIILCCTSRVEHIIGMCARLIAEHKVESMCGTAQRNAAFGAHSTQVSAQYHTEDRQAHKGTHSSKASKQYHTAQKQAQNPAHCMTKQRGKETKSITAATATKQAQALNVSHICSTRNNFLDEECEDPTTKRRCLD